jgi:RES domain-containing protein
VSLKLWRIAADTRTYLADDMQGLGAKITGGRWNDVGMAVVYASTSRALACLETMVHLNAGGLPLNRYLVEIEVPDDVWRAAETMEPDRMPVGWDAAPAGLVSIRLGSAWLSATSSALLFVPSIIVPEEQNALINPAHPEAGRILAQKVRKFLYDPRVRQISKP